ncbi:MAG: type II secretion system protein GspM [Ottowia sp.]|uniref:type II secretion system protein GspM n=1 Tax=Ottowia sp. TaxID=1898956 RepID=UPI003C7128E9
MNLRSPKALRSEHVWLLIAAAVLAAVLIAGIGFVAAKHHWATSTMEQLEPRYARLAGLRDSGERLKATEKELSANLARLAYGPDSDPAQAGNDALQRLRTAMASRGLQVSSSQVLPAREEGGFLRIGLNLRVDGDMTALRDLLRDMAAEQKPVIFGESIQFSSQPARTQQQNITTQLNLFVLKVQS